jgi:branched-chain amino acid transport system ATP-binding protein
MKPYEAASRASRTFQNVALFKGMSTLDNIMSGRTLKMHKNFFWQLLWFGTGGKRGDRTPQKGRGDHRFSRDPAHPQDAGGPLALWPAKAGRAGPALGMEPDLLLLDEPMAGMNLEEKEDMSRFILDVNSQNSAPPSP